MKNGSKILRAVLLVVTVTALALFAASCGGWAKKSSTLKFYVDGNEYHFVTAEQGAPVQAPNDPAKEHYEFDGWYLDPSCSGSTAEIPSVMPDKSCDYYGKLTPILYKITLVAQGLDLEPVVGEYGSAVSVPDPVKPDSKFEGWYLTPDFKGEAVEIPSTMPGENVTYYAKFSSTVAYIYYDANMPADADEDKLTGDMEPEKYPLGGDAVISDCAYEIEGWLFIGWSVDPEGEPDITQGEHKVGDHVTLDENLTLFAVWARGFVDSKGVSDDIIYIADIAGLGAATRVTADGEKKLGFVDRDEQNGIITGFTFMYDEGELVGIIGALADDEDNVVYVYTYRDEAYGNFAMYSYTTEEFYKWDLFADGYGNAMVSEFAVGEQLHTIYVGYYYPVGDGEYIFLAVDVKDEERNPLVPGEEDPSFYYDGTQGIFTNYSHVNDDGENVNDLPEGNYVGFYFVIDTSAIPEGGEDLYSGLFLVKEYDAGMYLSYEYGEIGGHCIELDGYGGIIVYDVDPDSGDPIYQYGAYYYVWYVDEQEFPIYVVYDVEGEEVVEHFRFVLAYMETVDGGYVYLYRPYDEEGQGDYVESPDKGHTLYCDGYGMAMLTIGGSEYVGYIVKGEEIWEFMAVDDEANVISTFYLHIDFAAKTFSLIEDGFIVDAGVLLDYTGDSSIIEIPGDVTSVAENALHYADHEGLNIVEVIIPASVEKIGAHAFENYYTLTKVTFLSETPIEIDWSSEGDPFRWPAGSFVIVVPESAKQAYIDAWSGCKYPILGSEEAKIQPEFQVDENGVLIRYNKPANSGDALELVIGKGQMFNGGEDIEIVEIAAGVFSGASYLKSVDLGGVKKIGDAAFENCANLTTVIFRSVETIGNSAFAACPLLTGGDSGLNFGSVRRIEQSAFYQDYALLRVIVNSSLEYVGVDAFAEISGEIDAPFFLVFESVGANFPELATGAAAIGTHTPFSGNAAYRIQFPDIDTVLKFYASDANSLLKGSLFVESGDEKGDYFDGNDHLELNGRAIFRSHDDVWMYGIDSGVITFYQYDRENSDYVTMRGTYSEGRISVVYADEQKNYVKAGETETYTSTDGKYNLTVDPRQLDPDRWPNPAHFEVDATLNGKPVKIIGKGYSSLEIDNFEIDGKVVNLTKIQITGKSFTYVEVVVSTSTEVTLPLVGLTSENGSTCTLEAKYGGIYGNVVLNDIDGHTLTNGMAFCVQLEDPHKFKIQKIGYMSTNYNVYITVSDDLKTFTIDSWEYWTAA